MFNDFLLEELRRLLVCVPVVVSIAQKRITQNTHTHTIDQSQVWTVGSEETFFTFNAIDSICTLCSHFQLKKKQHLKRKKNHLTHVKKNSFVSLVKQHFAEVKPGL